MYHITKANPTVIEAEGLTISAGRGFHRDAASDFNPPAVYLYDDISLTRRLFPRSRVHVYRVDVDGLPLESDQRWGGEGAWRIPQAIGPERLTRIHTYEPFDKPLVAEPA